MDEHVVEAIKFAKDALEQAGDPASGMSPDGYGEAAERATVLRQLLAILEAEEWCPPHSYQGQAGMVPGDAVLTCEICGDTFMGSWDDEGVKARPADAMTPCGRCRGGGWSGGVPWSKDPNVKIGHPCSICGGSGTSPRNDDKARQVDDRCERQNAKARSMGFRTAST